MDSPPLSSSSNIWSFIHWFWFKILLMGHCLFVEMQGNYRYFFEGFPLILRDKEMDKEGKNQKGCSEPDFLLRWGNRKRLRCVKVKDGRNVAEKSDCLGSKKITSRVDRRVVTAEKEAPCPQTHRLNRSSDSPMKNRENRKISATSPEKEDRYYTTRGSMGMMDDNGKVLMDHGGEDRGAVWPKLFISLSSKEKEEDFMAMKGCKLPQRPKKRAKLIQKTLLLVSPGAWLSDLCQERYEVREKKASKKRPRGLKAMGSMESDSE